MPFRIRRGMVAALKLDYSSGYSDTHLAKILKAFWENDETIFTSFGQICVTKERYGDITLLHGCPPTRGDLNIQCEVPVNNNKKKSPTVWPTDQNYLKITLKAPYLYS